ncbi:hypothetical protein ILUMI_11256 [Ignelater luminosus]|uniref:Uncharacterized protein n=1 Tax=Ignelater luminosus TaxID=2038154 RepID=A0A8K0D1S2_IGNLU|nr:hypothetical protein ILUMI_11256 [Ignelater luminosus]
MREAAVVKKLANSTDIEDNVLSGISFIAFNRETDINDHTSVSFIIDSGATEHLVQEDLDPLMFRVECLKEEGQIRIANEENIIASTFTKKVTNFIRQEEEVVSTYGVKLVGVGMHLGCQLKNKLHETNFKNRNNDRCVLTSGDDRDNEAVTNLTDYSKGLEVECNWKIDKIRCDNARFARKQQSVALSLLSEIEYIAARATAAKLISLKGIASDLNNSEHWRCNSVC